jgi:hypothetical protein
MHQPLDVILRREGRSLPGGGHDRGFHDQGRHTLLSTMHQHQPPMYGHASARCRCNPLLCVRRAPLLSTPGWAVMVPHGLAQACQPCGHGAPAPLRSLRPPHTAHPLAQQTGPLAQQQQLQQRYAACTVPGRRRCRSGTRCGRGQSMQQYPGVPCSWRECWGRRVR